MRSIMKIICIGRNYADHVKEMKSALPDEPVFFMKPDTSILRNNKPFFLPDFSNEIHYETELVIKISRLGRHIPVKFAHRYYDAVSVGIDFTARDLQRKCIQEGKPWEMAKSFDQAAVINRFIPLGDLPDQSAIRFSLCINGNTVQQGNSRDMIFSFDQIISYVSTFVTLKNNDLIYTGTPVGVGPVKKGDHLQGFLEDQLLLDFYVR